MKTIRRISTVVAAVALVCIIAAAQKMPTTTTQRIKGTPTVQTEQVSGTVVKVEGNTLLVRMSGGDLKEFVVPESRKFEIDGQTLTVHDLKPGTKLQATVTTTNTPVTERTTTVGTGKVWHVSGNTVILTLPNGENKMYKVKADYKFTVNGQKASIRDLRPGMTVAAEKIVEAPATELASDVAVTGHAPPPPKPKAEVAYHPAPVPAQPAAAEPAPAPAPVETARAEPPAKLPKTGSPLPAAGLLGLLLTGTSLSLRRLRRS